MTANATFSGTHLGTFQATSLTDGTSFAITGNNATVSITDTVSGHTSFVVGDAVTFTDSQSLPASGTYTYIGYVTISGMDYPVISQNGGSPYAIGVPLVYSSFPPPGGYATPNGTFHTAGMACFVTGTLISTPNGASRVEDLAVGAEVTTLLGGRAAEVIWVGTRRIDCTRHPEPSRVWPVRVAAHAFGDAAPSRDLLLSPEHAVYVDGALVPVGALINGARLVRQGAELETIRTHLAARATVCVAPTIDARSAA